MLHVGVEVEDGRPVVIHRASGDDVGELRSKSERLARAAHPGVVALRRAGASDGGFEMVTEHGGSPLGAVRELSPATLASIGAEVADTLCALHERGMVHGRVTVGRILLGRDGQVRLCGFGPDPTQATAADDVVALGAALETLAPREGAAALRAAASAAQAEDPERRPPARRLADVLRAQAQPPPRRDRRRPARLAVAAISATAVAVGLSLVGSSGAAPGPDPSGGEPGEATLSEASVVGPDREPTEPIEADRTSLEAPPCVAREGEPLVAAVCGHRVVVDGTAVVVDGQRSVVGAAADEVLVADWGCEGELKPVVLRPATGEVIVLSAPGHDGTRHVIASARVEGAVELAATTGSGDCPEPEAVTEAGGRVPVPVAGAAPDTGWPTGQ